MSYVCFSVLGLQALRTACLPQGESEVGAVDSVVQRSVSVDTVYGSSQNYTTATCRDYRQVCQCC